jgi:hypothetical protein
LIVEEKGETFPCVTLDTVDILINKNFLQIHVIQIHIYLCKGTYVDIPHKQIKRHVEIDTYVRQANVYYRHLQNGDNVNKQYVHL